MRILRNPDANIEDSSASTGAAAPQDDKSNASAPSGEAKTGKVEDAKGLLSMEAVVEAALKKGAPSSTNEPDGDGQLLAKSDEPDGNGEPPEGKPSEELLEKAQDDKDQKPVSPKKDDKPVEDELPPFHEHPRWKKVQSELQELKPLAERARILDDFVAKNRLDREDVANALQIAAVVRNDPAKALELLKPLVDQLSEYSGSKLPEDLQTKLDRGAISEEDAREIATLRGKKRFEEEDAKVSAAKSHVDRMTKTIDGWQESAKAKDFAFDKKFPLLNQVFQYRVASSPPKNEAEMVKLLEDCYSFVNDSVSKFAPAAPNGELVLPSRGSPKITTAKAKSVEDVVDAALAKHKSR
jgi:hypothetical protein